MTTHTHQPVLGPFRLTAGNASVAAVAFHRVPTPTHFRSVDCSHCFISCSSYLKKVLESVFFISQACVTSNKHVVRHTLIFTGENENITSSVVSCRSSQTCGLLLRTVLKGCDASSTRWDAILLMYYCS